MSRSFLVLVHTNTNNQCRSKPQPDGFIHRHIHWRSFHLGRYQPHLHASSAPRFDDKTGVCQQIDSASFRKTANRGDEQGTALRLGLNDPWGWCHFLRHVQIAGGACRAGYDNLRRAPRRGQLISDVREGLRTLVPLQCRRKACRLLKLTLRCTHNQRRDDETNQSVGRRMSLELGCDFLDGGEVCL